MARAAPPADPAPVEASGSDRAQGNRPSRHPAQRAAPEAAGPCIQGSSAGSSLTRNNSGTAGVQTPAADTPPSTLSSVRNCGKRTLLLWRRGELADPIPVELRCKSWRCPRCAWSVARSDYRRIEAGATSRPSWLYLVLTMDPSAHRSRWDAFRVAGELWDNRLRFRMQREWGKLEYVQTWEQHRSGWPHVNVLIRSDALLSHVAELGVEKREAAGPRGPRVALFPRWRTAWLARAAPAAGFGMRVWAELIEPRSSAAMAAYLAKVAGELTRSHLKGGDQRPTEAPKGFRRLRASRGLLPPRSVSTGEWTGVIAKRHPDTFADPATGEVRATWEDVEAAWLASADAAARDWHRHYRT